jgi:hypothetical protein
MAKNDGWTPAWEDVDAWGEPTTDFEREAIAELRAQQAMIADRPDGLGPTCIVYDEEVKIAERNLNTLQKSIDADVTLAEHWQRGEGPVLLKDTDAFLRQGDKGPYHWAQGPQDLTPVTTPSPPPAPVPPSPNPEPVKPGVLPKRGRAVTTTHLRLRRKAGTGHPSRGVLPTGTVVEMTGGIGIVSGDRWRRICVEDVPPQSKRLREPDQWIAAPPGVCGWVDEDFLAVPRSEYEMRDFPPVTHQFRWFLDDAGGLDHETVAKALSAIAQDPRGPLRAGVQLARVESAADAHTLVRMVDDACGGAAGCYYKRAGERARVDIGKEYFNTKWLSRVWLHEVFGHACSRSFDHYKNAPQYPREDYFGFMGNWQDQFGDHAWPDEDDIDNIRQWVQGRSDLVFVRDLEGG